MPCVLCVRVRVLCLLQDDEINYKPAHYDVKNRKDLEKKLQTFAEQGFGGISLNELKDSYDHVADDVYALGAAKKIIEITKNKGRARGGPDADSMIFWRDESVDVEIDKAFVAKFRAFEHDDAVTVRKYLEDKKEPVMKEAPKQEVGRKRKRKRANNNKRARPMANSHIEQCTVGPAGRPAHLSKRAASALVGARASCLAFDSCCSFLPRSYGCVLQAIHHLRMPQPTAVLHSRRSASDTTCANHLAEWGGFEAKQKQKQEQKGTKGWVCGRVHGAAGTAERGLALRGAR